MEDASLYMKWATNTLQHEHPGAAAADDFIKGTFPSLQALREASYAAEMVQELAADAHAPNSWSSGNGDTAANNNLLPRTGSWNFVCASSTHLGSSNGVMEAPAARGLPDLVHGPPPTRRTGLRGLGSMSASYAQDHIIAERKRREKINQRFIELSTVIPGLKKMDKATILSDATRYVKELQEKVKDLEAGGSSGRSIETRLVLVKRPCGLHAAAAAAADDDVSPFSPSPGTPTTARKELPPEIEVRFSEKSVMVRVHCENSKGVVVKVLTEMEELQLTIIHANAMQFSACNLIIAITAKVDEGFTITKEEIVDRLDSALLKQHSSCCHEETGTY